MPSPVDVELEEEIEKKTELFFAVIRNIKEARERQSASHKLKRSSSLMEDERETKVTRNKEPKLVWNPSFEWEDFVDKSNNKKDQDSPPVKNDSTFGSSSSKGEEEMIKTTNCGNSNGDGKQGLDLNLSL